MLCMRVCTCTWGRMCKEGAAILNALLQRWCHMLMYRAHGVSPALSVRLFQLRCAFLRHAAARACCAASDLLVSDRLRSCKVGKDTLVVLWVDGDEPGCTTVTHPVAVRSKAKHNHHRGAELSSENEERKLAERRLHPIPCPRANLEPGVQLTLAGHFKRDKGIVEPEDGR